MTGLTDDERKKFEAWILENIDIDIVPRDEGDEDALLYNLIHWVRGDGKLWDYKDDQYQELKSWGRRQD